MIHHGADPPIGTELLVVALLHLRALDAGETIYDMQRMVVADPMGHLLALSATLAMMVTLGYARPYLAARRSMSRHM